MSSPAGKKKAAARAKKVRATAKSGRRAAQVANRQALERTLERQERWPRNKIIVARERSHFEYRRRVLVRELGDAGSGTWICVLTGDLSAFQASSQSIRGLRIGRGDIVDFYELWDEGEAADLAVAELRRIGWRDDHENELLEQKRARRWAKARKEVVEIAREILAPGTPNP